jgi:glycosyltransferase involved in cell wall biosynthesis
VHGRFHAFDLARALLERGHDVTLFTNYPKWAVKRFDFPTDRVRSFWVHGVLGRVSDQVQRKKLRHNPEPWLHPLFGRWVAKRIGSENWDVVVCWSGVGEEIFDRLLEKQVLRICHRSSSHIRVQARLLGEEEKRIGAPLDHPDDWIIAREEREYTLADVIYAPSSFARESFLAQGASPGKVVFIPHGVSTKAFRPSQEVVDARCARILSGKSLRVLNVGTFSFRKGMWDTAEVIRRLSQDKFEFRFVGPIAPEASFLASDLRDSVTFVGVRPQRELPVQYAWGDIFILPTIEDGFPFVLAQASAAALPILTTPNGAGTDLVRDNETGWVLPIRSPEAFIERLRWCDAHREELARMVRRIYDDFRPSDWSDVAADFEAICFQGVEAKRLRGLEARRLRG